MKTLFRLHSLFLFVTALVSTTPAALGATKEVVKRHADAYFVDKQIQRSTRRSEPVLSVPTHVLRQLKNSQLNCIDDDTVISPKSCIDTICAKLNKSDCDDISEVQNIAKMCKNNVDGDCINAVCSKVSKFDCDDASELEQIAGMCSGHFSDKCLTVTCSFLHKFDCDDLSEVDAILTNTCTPNVDPDCVKSVCSKMHKFDCDDLSEIQSVAKACSGN